MNTTKFYLNLLLSVMALGLYSCSSENNEDVEPNLPIPDQPVIEIPDTLSIKKGSNIDVIETPFESRAGNSRDLLGVEIMRKTSGSATN